jgi:hypothetical protein
MMMLRTESDFIIASNQAYDLAGIVVAYLKLHRQYVNGYNGVSVPDKEFAVTFKPPSTEGFVTTVLHWTDWQTHTETQYYDVDSDYFSESWGADNSCGETSYTVDYAESKGIDIPIKHLMMTKDQMVGFFKDKKIKVEAEYKEIARKKEIERLENELNKLKVI